MSRLAIILLLLLPLASLAFDFSAWLGKREMMAREAERLRVAYTNCCAKAVEPAEGVKVPIETHADGSVKMILEARRMYLFHKQPYVLAEDVVISKLDEDGSVTARIEAGRCVVDRESRSGWIEGPARITKGKTRFDGRDMYFSSAESYVSAFGSSDMLSDGAGMGGLL